MISVKMTGTHNVQSILAKLQGINRIVEKWMKSGSPDYMMQRSFSMNFAHQGRPEKWAELAEDTKVQRDYEGYDEGPILQRSGNLMDEITSMQGKVLSTMNYSRKTWGIDQLSNDAKRKFGPNQLGKGKRGQDLPERTMIGFQKTDGKKLVTDLRSFILKSL